MEYTFSRGYAKNPTLRKTDLSKTDLRKNNLCDLDCERANLGEANLSDANLQNADLSEANVHKANLKALRALNTKFNNATFTGACIEDWNINSETSFKGVNCKHIFLKQGISEYEERRPSSGSFASGDFVKLVQKSISTVDLIFRKGINWEAFAHSLQKLQAKTKSDELDIQAIENKGDGDYHSGECSP